MTSANRNIVLLTIDSLRADHCGFMNPSMDATPALDQMAAEGLVFETAIAPGPRTPSSIPEILTGEMLPKRTGDLHNSGKTRQWMGKHVEEYETVGEKLSRMGYSTAAYTANPWTTGLDIGFDRFHSIGSSESGHFRQVFSGTNIEPVVKLLGQWWNKEDWFSNWRTFYSDLVSTIKQLDEPYFVWVFLLDTHNPYIVPRQDRFESSTLGMYYSTARGNAILGDRTRKSSYKENLSPNVERRIKQAYRDSIRSVDRFVNTLQQDLENDDPTIVFHADHGEAFNEHGTYGHQRRLYEENIHVPLLVYNSDSSGRIQEPVTLRTLPEILLACGKNDESLTQRPWTTEYAFARTEDNAWTVRDNRWKYIESAESEELYDLAADPHEQENVIGSQEEAVERLREVMAAYVAELPEDSVSDEGERVSSELKERLESLGYTS